MNNNDWPKKQIMWVKDRTLYVSIPFTWNLPEVKELLKQKSFEWDRAIVGGPAAYLMPGYFDGLNDVTIGDEMSGVLQKVNPMATKTTTEQDSHD